jgi:Lar family restriction alleviation protein
MTDDLKARGVPELLPCPFCGGEASTRYIRDGREAWCRGCGAAGASAFHGPLTIPPAEDRAIAAWNRRAARSIPRAVKALVADAEARGMERAANMVALAPLAYLPHSPGAVAFFADPTGTLNSAADAIRAEAAAIRKGETT